MNDRDKRESRIEVMRLPTYCERLLIEEIWGRSNDVPDYIREMARERVILDGIEAQKSAQIFTVGK